MGVKRLRDDSVKELRKQKTRAQLQAENEKLQAKVERLENGLLKLHSTSAQVSHVSLICPVKNSPTALKVEV